MDVETGAPADTAVIEAPVVDAPAIPPADTSVPPATEIKADPKDRRAVIAEAMKTPTNRGKHAAFQPREQGKFAGPPATPPVAEVVPKVRPALLKSLKKDLEPHWNAAPTELLEAFTQREADFDKGITQYRTQAEQAAAVLDQFKPYEWMLRNEGATPQTAIAPLLQTAAILRTGTPAQKAQSVAQVMQQFGIPIEHIQAVFQPGGQQPAAMDPQYNHLAQQVQSLQQSWQQTQQQQEQMQNQRAMTVIQQFAADPKNVHFAQVQDKMLALLQTPQILGPDVQFMSEREKLTLAYDAAVRLDPTLAAQALAQQQAQAQAQQRQQAQAAANTAKAAAVQVKGAPGAPLAATVNTNDRRAVIANALRQAQA